MTLPVLGIDISKRKFDAALLVGDKTLKKACSNSPEGFAELVQWLVRRGVEQVHACMEATSVYGEALATALADAGHVVSMINPARIQGFAKGELLRTKTDQVDAALIARFCLAMHPEAWQPLPTDVRALRDLVHRLDVLNEQRQEEISRLDTLGPDSPARTSISAHLAFLQTEIAAVEARIRAHFDQHPDLRQKRDLLMTIPGIAEKTAAIILAEIRQIEAYRSARQLAAYAGLAPREFTSGSSVRGRPRLCKTGNARLRKALYMPAVVAKTHNSRIHAFCERLLAKGKAPKAVVAAAMRKLLHIAFGMLKSGQPFQADHGLIACS